MNLTEEELNTILKVCKRIAKKYVFGSYTVEDIEQEAFIIACAALPAYNKDKGPLENFIQVHLKNRLFNFKRDNFFRPPQTICSLCGSNDPYACDKCSERYRKAISRRSLLEAAEPKDEVSEYTHTIDNLEKMEYQELIDKINTNLPIEMRVDYLRLLDGAHINKQRRLEIEQEILRIVNE